MPEAHAANTLQCPGTTSSLPKSLSPLCHQMAEVAFAAAESAFLTAPRVTCSRTHSEGTPKSSSFEPWSPWPLTSHVIWRKTQERRLSSLHFYAVRTHPQAQRGQASGLHSGPGQAPGHKRAPGHPAACPSCPVHWQVTAFCSTAAADTLPSSALGSGPETVSSDQPQHPRKPRGPQGPADAEAAAHSLVPERS